MFCDSLETRPELSIKETNYCKKSLHLTVDVMTAY